MNQWLVRISLFINYFVFAILLNSVGTVILQVQNTWGPATKSNTRIGIGAWIPF